MSIAKLIRRLSTSSTDSSDSKSKTDSHGLSDEEKTKKGISRSRPASVSEEPSAPNRTELKREGSSCNDVTKVLPAKKTPNDFIFGKLIGEGSYSTVYLAKEISSKKEFAIKVLEKKHIVREKKTKYVMREKEVFIRCSHPFIVQMYSSFQDVDRLYFVLQYARRGELLDYLHKLGSFDECCTQFYTAELVVALEHLHSLKIIHRDLKPENILLNENMHILITDFGSAKILDKADDVTSDEQPGIPRKSSFVGTAQYVSPDMLTSKSACYSSDLWALGCIIYQFLAGSPPFKGGHEFQIFQKIIKLEYDFPEGFSSLAKELVKKLLVLEPKERLGCPEMGGYEPLKSHEFFQSVNWNSLPDQKAPELLPYLPATSNNPNLWGKYRPGLDEKRIGEIMTQHVITETERKSLLKKQSDENEYHRFVENNLILKQGLIDKRKGLFARRRMLLLTEGPHLYYVDPSAKVLKGQIPWSEELRPEAKNFKIFFVHTPNRTYYLEDPESKSQAWVEKIEEVWRQYYLKKD